MSNALLYYGITWVEYNNFCFQTIDTGSFPYRLGAQPKGEYFF